MVSEKKQPNGKVLVSKSKYQELLKENEEMREEIDLINSSEFIKSLKSALDDLKYGRYTVS